jgi:hypothetical protein
MKRIRLAGGHIALEMLDGELFLSSSPICLDYPGIVQFLDSCIRAAGTERKRCAGQSKMTVYFQEPEPWFLIEGTLVNEMFHQILREAFPGSGCAGQSNMTVYFQEPEPWFLDFAHEQGFHTGCTPTSKPRQATFAEPITYKIELLAHEVYATALERNPGMDRRTIPRKSIFCMLLDGRIKLAQKVIV